MRTFQEIFDVVLANDLYPLPDTDYPAMCNSLARAWFNGLVTMEEEHQAVVAINGYLDKLGGGVEDSAYLQRQLAITFNLDEYPPVEITLAIYRDWDRRPTSIGEWQELLASLDLVQQGGGLKPTKPVNHNLEPHLIGDFWVESGGEGRGN